MVTSALEALVSRLKGSTTLAVVAGTCGSVALALAAHVVAVKIFGGDVGVMHIEYPPKPLNPTWMAAMYDRIVYHRPSPVPELELDPPPEPPEPPPGPTETVRRGMINLRPYRTLNWVHRQSQQRWPVENWL